MPFDHSGFMDMLEQYLKDNVSIKIIDYYGDQDPIGVGDLGVNIDVGEVNSFDVEIKNDGNLGMLNVAVNVIARHGLVSGTYSGFVNIFGSQWMDPWQIAWQSRQFNLGPNDEIKLKHEVSGGHLFGYKATETTGGSDNNRDVETLLTARIAYWQPDLQNLVLKSTEGGPEDTYENFIQRS